MGANLNIEFGPSYRRNDSRSPRESSTKAPELLGPLEQRLFPILFLADGTLDAETVIPSDNPGLGYPKLGLEQELWGEACQEPDALGAGTCWIVAESTIPYLISVRMAEKSYHRRVVQGHVFDGRKAH